MKRIFLSVVFVLVFVLSGCGSVNQKNVICTGFSSDNYKTTKAPSTTSCGVR